MIKNIRFEWQMMKKWILFCVILSMLFTSNQITLATISPPMEMLPWDTVNELIPNKSVFTVLDVETGKTFSVQRRAGNRHADVQPITANDTKIMKEIYGGNWNWRRRAIIVITNDTWIPASMHGMPHGAGSLQNNFPGHFCIHFNGSTTHRTNEMDLSHQLMIYKAAGNVRAFAAKMKPVDVVSSFFAALKQHDPYLMETFSYPKVLYWKIIFPEMENIKLLKVSPDQEKENELHLTYTVTFEWTNTDYTRVKDKGKIHLIRLSPTEPWKVATVKMINGRDKNE